MDRPIPNCIRTVLIAVGCSVAVCAQADLDRPGPPALRREAWLKESRLTAGVNSELGDETWRLKLTFDHGAHGKLEFSAEGVTPGTARLPFEHRSMRGDWHVGGRSDSVGRGYDAYDLSYRHTECSPATELLVHAQLEETDLDTFGKATTGVVGGIAGLLTAGVGELVAAGIGVGLTGLGVGIEIGSSDDDYGSAMAVVPAEGLLTLRLAGSSGSADLVIESRTTLLPFLPGCEPETNRVQLGLLSPTPGTTPDLRVSGWYGRIDEGFLQTALIQPQPGNPAGLSASQIQSVQESYEHALTGLGRMLAAALIQGTLDREGVLAALEEFQTGEQAAGRGAFPEATFHFRTAAREAILAQLNEPARERVVRPKRLVLESPVLNATGRSQRRLKGMVLGLQPGESIQAVEVDPPAPIRARINPTGRHTVVALNGALGPFRAGDIIGLDRFEGGTVMEGECANGNALVLKPGPNGEIALTGIGRFRPPESPCGVGRLLTTTQFVRGGGVPAAAFSETGEFYLEIDLGGAAPGTALIPILARVRNLAGDLEFIEAGLQIQVKPPFGRPAIQAELAGAALRMSWPTNGTAFRVESCAALDHRPVTWAPALGVLATNGPEMVFTASRGSAPESAAFFRVISEGLTNPPPEWALPVLAVSSGVPGGTVRVSGALAVPPGETPALRLEMPWGAYSVPLTGASFFTELPVPGDVSPGDFLVTARLEGLGGRSAAASRNLLLTRGEPSIDAMAIGEVAPGFPAKLAGYLSGGDPPYRIETGSFYALAERGSFGLWLPTPAQLSPGEHPLEIRIWDSGGIMGVVQSTYTLVTPQALGAVVLPVEPARSGSAATLRGEVFGGLPPWSITAEGVETSVSGSIAARDGGPYRFELTLVVPQSTQPGVYRLATLVTDAAGTRFTGSVELTVQP